MSLDYQARVVISEGIGEAISDSTDSASPLGSEGAAQSVGSSGPSRIRRGTDNFIICRDPASARLSGDCFHNHSKEGCDPRENRDASIPVVAPIKIPIVIVSMMGPVPTGVPATS